MKKLICAAAAFVGVLLSPSSLASDNEVWSALRHDLFAFEWRFNPADSPARLGRDLANFRGLSLHGATGNLAFAAFGAVDDPQKPFSVKLAQVALAAGGAALAVYALDNRNDDSPTITSSAGDAPAAEGQEVGLSLEEVVALIDHPDTPPELAAALQAVIGQTSHLPGEVGDDADEIYTAKYAEMIENDGNLDHGTYNNKIVTSSTSGSTTTYTIRSPLSNIQQSVCEDYSNCEEFEADSDQMGMVSVRVRHCGDENTPRNACGTQAERSAAGIYLACQLGDFSGGGCTASSAEQTSAATALNSRLAGIDRTSIFAYYELHAMFYAPIPGYTPRRPDYLRVSTVQMEKYKTITTYENGDRDTPVYLYAGDDASPHGEAVHILTWECPTAGGACTGGTGLGGDFWIPAE